MYLLYLSVPSLREGTVEFIVVLEEGEGNVDFYTVPQTVKFP